MTKKTKEKKMKKVIMQSEECHRIRFHGIECLESKDEYGFEGCYNNKLNHPDPRPAHRIWIKKLYAEKLFILFNRKERQRLKAEVEKVYDKMLNEDWTPEQLLVLTHFLKRLGIK